MSILISRIAQMEHNRGKNNTRNRLKELWERFKCSSFFLFLEEWGTRLIRPIAIIITTAIILIICLVGVRGVYYNVNDPNEFYSFTVSRYKFYYDSLGEEKVDEGKWKVKDNSIYFTYEDELLGKTIDEYYFKKDGNGTIFIGENERQVSEYERVQLSPFSSFNKKVKVTFDANGGEGGLSEKIKLGSIIEKTPEVTRDGYRFVGWYTESDSYRASSSESYRENVRIWEEVTYYANWCRIYDVIIDGEVVCSLEEGTPLLAQLKKLDEKIQYEVSYYLDGALIDENTLMPKHSITVTKEISLKLDANGGVFGNGKELQTLKIIYNTDNSNLQFSVPSKLDHLFLGFYSDGGTIVTDRKAIIKDNFWEKINSGSYLKASWLSLSDYSYGLSDNDQIYITKYKGTSQVVNIPYGVIGIDSKTFYGCSGITCVAIPDSVIGIGSRAFYKCSSLINITMPNSVTSIGTLAFYKCSGLESITIPDSVTSIGSSAFYGCSSLKGVYITDLARWCEISFGDSSSGNTTNPLYIAGNLYLNNTLITDLIIPDSVTSISSRAFVGCSSLISVTIPDSVTSIGSGAFYSCSSLVKVTIPDSVTSIESYVFSCCRSLVSVIIPDSVTSIGEGAFPDCDNLTSVTIGSAVTSIGDFAFHNCYKLVEVYNKSSLEIRAGSSANGYVGYYAKNIYTEESGSKLFTVDGFIIYTDGDDKLLVGYDGTEVSITIPSEITEIYKYAFYNCSSLESVTIPDSVKSIGSYAFYGCIGLTCVTIGESVTSIDNYAFYNCYKLVEVYNKSSLDITAGSSANGHVGYYAIDIYNEKYGSKLSIDDDGYIIYTDGADQFLVGYKGNGTSIVIPNGITIINPYAFSGCRNLTSVTIGDSVKSIGCGAFHGCSTLNKVYITDLAKWCGISFDGCFANPLYYAGNLYLNNTLVTDLVIPDNVMSIGDYAFYNCSSITSATIGVVTSINSYAFSGCSSLTHVTIPDSVTSIGSSVFYNCSSLESITLPFVGGSSDSTEASSSTLFGYIFGTSSYTGGASTTQYYSSNSWDSVTYYIPSTLKDVTITGGNILYGAFYNCRNLTSVIIGVVTSIGSSAFEGCSGLTSITIPDSVTSIDSNAFRYCSSLTNITIGVVTSIGSSAFSGCSSLTHVTIPDSVTSIGLSVFYNCSSLESITLPFVGGSSDSTEASSSTLFGYIFGTSSYTGGTSTKQYYSSSFYKTYYIPNTLKNVTVTGGNILYGSFYNCSNIVSVTIGDVVTSIGSHAFYNCSSLTSITIPDSVTSIGSSAFEGCSGLTSITIPDSVTSIGSSAFSGCSSLESITLPFVGGSSDSTEASDSTLFGYIFGTSSYTGGTATRQYYYYTSPFYTTYYIPTTLKNVTITGGNILYGSFCNCSNLTSVTIGVVTSIGFSAFSGCSNLNAVNITDLAKWCEISFGGIDANPLYYADNLYLNGTLVTELLIPEDVTRIGSYAFSGCSSLTSVTIPDSVTSIGSYAFYGCSGLTSVTIPDSVTSIGSYAFYGCSGLASITIPDSVTSIGSSVFYNCSSLESITLPFVGGSLDSTEASSSTLFGYIFGTSSYTGGTSTKQYYSSSSYKTYYIPNTLKNVTVTGGNILYGSFYNCSNIVRITIGNSVTSIGSSAFYNCSSLESITLPFVGGSLDSTEASSSTLFGYIFGTSSYTGGTSTTQYYSYSSYETYYIPNALKSVTVTGGNILYGSFYNCSNIVSITIGDNVTRIRPGAFAYCTSLTDITIPDNVTSIGSYAFSGCSSLTHVTIPDSVTSIGSSVFYNCGKLESITLPFVGGSSDSTEAISSTLFGYIFGTSSYTGGTSTTQYYSYSSYKTYYIPNALKSVTVTGGNILYGSFYNCSNIVSITIGDNVTSIGSDAFSGCSSLESITIPDSVTNIDSFAFSGCSSLVSITIPDSVTRIDSYAFYNCSSLESITIPDSVTSIGSAAFSGCSSLSSITIPDSVTSIGYFAFSGCSSLKGVYITDLAKWCEIDFGDYEANPLYNAGNLYLNNAPITDLVIPDSVTCIGEYAFSGCSSFTSITIPGSVVRIRSFAFSGCSSLTSIMIPDSVTNIDSFAFSGCSSLVSITIPDSVTRIDSYAFSGCSSLVSITIPDSVTRIDSYAFSGCSSLTSVTIGNSVTSIGSYAFYNCSNLSRVTIGKSVTSIGYSAFYGCSSLTSIMIPDSVTNIDSFAFSGCSSLTSVTIGNSVTSIGSYAFYNCSSLSRVTIGKSVTSIGEDAFKYCKSLTSITIPDSITSIGSYAFYGCSSLTSIVFEDTSTWYGTTNYTNWENKTGGTQISVSDPSLNVTYFTDTYYNYYWYKK